MYSFQKDTQKNSVAFLTLMPDNPIALQQPS